jgi:hypothetical protein
VQFFEHPELVNNRLGDIGPARVFGRQPHTFAMFRARAVSQRGIRSRQRDRAASDRQGLCLSFGDPPNPSIRRLRKPVEHPAP